MRGCHTHAWKRRQTLEGYQSFLYLFGLATYLMRHNPDFLDFCCDNRVSIWGQPMKPPGDKGSGRRSHGMSGSPEYKSWSAMRRRCSNPKASDFPYYGGRGITVCAEWDRFEVFIADMGKMPMPGMTIDRRDGLLGYSPENCRWATRKEQAQNFRQNVTVDYLGETMCLSEAARRAGLNVDTVKTRRLDGAAEALWFLPEAEYRAARPRVLTETSRLAFLNHARSPRSAAHAAAIGDANRRRLGHASVTADTVVVVQLVVDAAHGD